MKHIRTHLLAVFACFSLPVSAAPNAPDESMRSSAFSQSRLPAQDGTDAPAREPEDCAEKKPAGFLSLQTVPWTRVEIDGQPVGSTPLFRTKLAAGVHTVRVFNAAFDIDMVQDVEVTPALTQKLSLDFQNARADSAVGDADNEDAECVEPVLSQGFLTVQSQPWARVFVDGKSVGSTPLFRFALPAGEHAVRLSRDDNRAQMSVMTRVRLVSGAVVKLDVDAPEAKWPRGDRSIDAESKVKQHTDDVAMRAQVERPDADKRLR